MGHRTSSLRCSRRLTRHPCCSCAAPTPAGHRAATARLAQEELRPWKQARPKTIFTLFSLNGIPGARLACLSRRIECWTGPWCPYPRSPGCEYGAGDPGRSRYHWQLALRLYADEIFSKHGRREAHSDRHAGQACRASRKRSGRRGSHPPCQSISSKSIWRAR